MFNSTWLKNDFFNKGSGAFRFILKFSFLLFIFSGSAIAGITTISLSGTSSGFLRSFAQTTLQTTQTLTTIGMSSVTLNAGWYVFDVYGPGGGGGRIDSYNGGNGGFGSATMYIPSPTTLYFYVGSAGGTQGGGKLGTYAGANNDRGGNGAEFSGIFSSNSVTQAAAIAIAGGGGGSGGGNGVIGAVGGAGGGFNQNGSGGNASTTSGGTAGTTSSGGTNANSSAAYGSALRGGNGYYVQCCHGGGGGGSGYFNTSVSYYASYTANGATFSGTQGGGSAGGLGVSNGGSGNYDGIDGKIIIKYYGN